jgi:hypothetical protein
MSIVSLESGSSHEDSGRPKKRPRWLRIALDPRIVVAALGVVAAIIKLATAIIAHAN